MNQIADKIRENKRQAVANGLPKQRNSSVSASQFVDNRPVAIAQRKMQDALNNRPVITQLKTFKGMTNSFPLIKQLKADQNKSSQAVLNDPIVSRGRPVQLMDNGEEENHRQLPVAPVRQGHSGAGVGSSMGPLTRLDDENEERISRVGLGAGAASLAMSAAEIGSAAVPGLGALSSGISARTQGQHAIENLENGNLLHAGRNASAAILHSASAVTNLIPGIGSAASMLLTGGAMALSAPETAATIAATANAVFPSAAASAAEPGAGNAVIEHAQDHQDLSSSSSSSLVSPPSQASSAASVKRGMSKKERKEYLAGVLAKLP